MGKSGQICISVHCWIIVFTQMGMFFVGTVSTMQANVQIASNDCHFIVYWRNDIDIIFGIHTSKSNLDFAEYIATISCNVLVCVELDSIWSEISCKLRSKHVSMLIGISETYIVEN